MTYWKFMALAICLLTAASATNAHDLETVYGQVIQVTQEQQTENQGLDRRLWIRTEQGEEMQLRLGFGEPCPGCPVICPDCLKEGDRVRARLWRGGDGAWQVDSIRVRRGRRMFDYRLGAPPGAGRVGRQMQGWRDRAQGAPPSLSGPRGCCGLRCGGAGLRGTGARGRGSG